MTERDEPGPTAAFWKSRTGVTLLAFLGVAALLLGWEHGLHLFAGDAFAVLLLIGSFLMHLFMHGGHGGHGGGGDR